MDGRKFRDIAGSFATGVTIITTKSKSGKPVGMTANSFASLSLEPLMVLFNIDRKASLYEDFMTTETFAVNILSADQEDLSRRFATKDIERFEGIPFSEDATGSPILDNVIGYFDCKVANRFDGGDHTIIIGEVMSGDVRDKEPLVFYRGKYIRVS